MANSVYKINREELSEKIYITLKNMILKNEIRLGQKLKQEELAQKLGVSRMPLHAAFAKLEKEMLIDIIPHKGAFVKKLSKKELIDLYDIRIKLETLGAYDAAKNRNNDQIQRLKKIITQYQELINLNDPSNMHKIENIDYNFHIEIMKMSNNSFLYKMISSYNIIIICNLYGLMKKWNVSADEHWRIFNAINDKKAKDAELFMYKHINEARENLLLLELENRNEKY